MWFGAAVLYTCTYVHMACTNQLIEQLEVFVPWPHLLQQTFWLLYSSLLQHDTKCTEGSYTQ